MTLVDIIVILVIAAVVAGISIYLYRAKKRGERCIGCPYAKQCSAGGGNCRSERGGK